MSSNAFPALERDYAEELAEQEERRAERDHAVNVQYDETYRYLRGYPSRAEEHRRNEEQRVRVCRA